MAPPTVRPEIGNNQIYMDSHLIKAFSLQLYRCVGWRVVAALSLALVLALLQGVGILLLFPLLELVGISNGDNNSPMLRQIKLWFGYFNLSPSLLLMLTLVLVVVSVRELLMLLQSVLHAIIQQTLVMQLRLNLFKAVTYLEWLHFTRSKPAIFTQTLVGDIGRIGVGTQSLITLFTTSLLSLCYLAIAMVISLKMTGIVILCGLVTVLFLWNSFRKAGQLGVRQTEVNNNLYVLLTEHFNALRLTKAYTAQQQSTKIFKNQCYTIKQLFIGSMLNQAQIKMRFNLVSVVIFCFFLLIAINWLSLSSASLLVLIVIFSRVIPQISNIWQNYNRLCQMAPAFSAYNRLLDSCRKQQENLSFAASKFVGFRDEIRFINVDFSYEPNAPKLFKSLNFSIKAGELTAIVGPSGAGKSTIADLVMGLLKAENGEIRIDDVNLAECNLNAWLHHIAYVPQENFLFNDTVRANLLWAKPNATEVEIQQCIRDAELEYMINLLPDGLDTVVGDRGGCLSGGERQRLVLARALLLKSKILILDEATSELDMISQYKIQQVIEKIRTNSTIIMISHRLDTIKNADRIIVIDRGTVIDTGSWVDLKNRNHSSVQQLLKQASL